MWIYRPGHAGRPVVRKCLRRDEAGHTLRFLTFTCDRFLPLFGNDRIKDAFALRLGHACEHARVALVAWVVMPDHVHLLVLPPPETTSAFLHGLKRLFGRQVITRWRELDAPVLARVRVRDGKHRFWQAGGGFDRTVETAAEAENDVGYIHANPVEAGLVARDVDWRWSSARYYAGGAYDGPPIARVAF